MKLWRNVLVHVDGTAGTPAALEKSLLVAAAFDGRVIAFDSIEPDSGPLPFHYPTLRPDHLLEFAAAARTEQLREELAALEQRVPVETMVGRGAPGRALLGCASRSDTDLIVKAASAADVQRMTASGRTALHLLRASQVPVWLYAPPARRSGRVVAAVNLSGPTARREELNERVVLAAARLASLEDAELHVVCVADRARDRLYESILRPVQYRSYLTKDRRDLRQALTDLTTRLAPRSVSHLVEDNALDALQKIVRELEADALVLGRDDAHAHAHAGMLGMYFPERLFCRIDRSMLLVPPKLASARSRVTPRGQSASRASTRDAREPGDTAP